MERFFTKTFFKFFFGFVALVTVAFVVMISATKYLPAPAEVDSVAHPR